MYQDKEDILNNYKEVLKETIDDTTSEQTKTSDVYMVLSIPVVLNALIDIRDALLDIRREIKRSAR